jgi:hypothetical protein
VNLEALSIEVSVSAGVDLRNPRAVLIRQVLAIRSPEAAAQAPLRVKAQLDLTSPIIYQVRKGEAEVYRTPATITGGRIV